jgi:hypothetical protein
LATMSAHLHAWIYCGLVRRGPAWIAIETCAQCAGTRERPATLEEVQAWIAQ